MSFIEIFFTVLSGSLIGSGIGLVTGIAVCKILGGAVFSWDEEK